MLRRVCLGLSLGSLSLCLSHGAALNSTDAVVKKSASADNGTAVEDKPKPSKDEVALVLKGVSSIDIDEDTQSFPSVTPISAGRWFHDKKAIFNFLPVKIPHGALEGGGAPLEGGTGSKQKALSLSCDGNFITFHFQRPDPSASTAPGSAGSLTQGAHHPPLLLQTAVSLSSQTQAETAEESAKARTEKEKGPISPLAAYLPEWEGLDFFLPSVHHKKETLSKQANSNSQQQQQQLLQESNRSAVSSLSLSGGAGVPETNEQKPLSHEPNQRSPSASLSRSKYLSVLDGVRLPADQKQVKGKKGGKLALVAESADRDRQVQGGYLAALDGLKDDLEEERKQAEQQQKRTPDDERRIRANEDAWQRLLNGDTSGVMAVANNELGLKASDPSSSSSSSSSTDPNQKTENSESTDTQSSGATSDSSSSLANRGEETSGSSSSVSSSLEGEGTGDGSNLKDAVVSREGDKLSVTVPLDASLLEKFRKQMIEDGNKLSADMKLLEQKASTKAAQSTKIGLSGLHLQTTSVHPEIRPHTQPTQKTETPALVLAQQAPAPTERKAPSSSSSTLQEQQQSVSTSSAAPGVNGPFSPQAQGHGGAGGGGGGIFGEPFEVTPESLQDPQQQPAHASASNRKQQTETEMGAAAGASAGQTQSNKAEGQTHQHMHQQVQIGGSQQEEDGQQGEEEGEETDFGMQGQLVAEEMLRVAMPAPVDPLKVFAVQFAPELLIVVVPKRALRAGNEGGGSGASGTFATRSVELPVFDMRGQPVGGDKESVII
uniref:Uncharacterized protein n=1 Tax=Chromera velia CCMP2878 TaxID=1169474 RepID=A0A0G4I5T4_9ALVE|eukprot:Cvel_63.t1-p1 / transcript=Cvel_63.t1 / gene=Cvel_63 / organism=Chromera_velia_CCMP2878 / gene_product=hypothetical protein / transcript_product=hypothetical protein / location=Cvel_scaffold6:61454-67615(+) / protein_length=773 / sequence_SO=supercontig / SO=protein_coding / is_pseudo=false